MGDNAPTDFLGYDTAQVFNGLALFLVIFILGFASPVNASIMTLGGVGVLWAAYYWGWLTMTGDSTKDAILMGFILMFAVAYRFKQAKEDKG